MLGAVNMFINSFNDYLARFPKFRLDPTYIEKTKFLIEGLRGYLNDVEADILLASEETSKADAENWPRAKMARSVEKSGMGQFDPYQNEKSNG